MSVSGLKDELAKAVPFRFEYSFEMAGASFLKTHPNLNPALSKQWQQAFKLGASSTFDMAARHFEQLADGVNGTSGIALFNFAMCNLLGERLADAAIIFQRAEDITPYDDYWLHIYSGFAHFALGLVIRANHHWWIASRKKGDEIGKKLIHRYLTYEFHPERMALYPLCKGKGIDVGCGFYKIHPTAIGVDLVLKGERMTTAGNVMNRASQADIVCSGDNLTMFCDGGMDYVVQKHNLEHYQDPIKALQEWLRVLKPGGILGMVIPDDESCDTIHLDDTHKHVFTQSSLNRLLQLLPSVKIVHLGPMLYQWSFICVAQKVHEGQEPTFSYFSCIKDRENEEIRRRIDLYAQNGLTGLVGQCRRYLQISNRAGHS